MYRIKLAAEFVTNLFVCCLLILRFFASSNIFRRLCWHSPRGTL